MFRQYFKQAIQMLKENRLTSVISILGTALSIAMILVVILQFQIKLVGFRPESNRDRMLYIMGIRADSRDSETRNSTAMSDGVVKITLIGGLIGIVLSVILLQLGKSFLLTKDTVVTFEMLFKPVLFAAALFFTLLLNLLSAGLPAIRISREQIVEALNNK